MTHRPAPKNPTCTRRHHGQWVGRVSWPADLDPGAGPSASTYVCPRQACQDEAAAWVEAITGHRGVFVPLPLQAGRQEARDAQ